MAKSDLSVEQRQALRAELKATQKLFKDAKMRINMASTPTEKVKAAKDAKGLADDCARLKAQLAG